jgi:hypothetical protein
LKGSNDGLFEVLSSRFPGFTEENCKGHLRELGCGGMDSTDLSQGRHQWRALCEHGNEPSGSLKCWETLEHQSDWRLLKDSLSWS